MVGYWVGLCQALFQSIEEEEWVEMHEKLQGVPRTTTVDENITQAFSVFGILLVMQAAAEIPAGLNFACNSRGAFALQHVKGCVVTLFLNQNSVYITCFGPCKN